MSERKHTCQSTNLKEATLPLRAWDIRQYVWDIGSGTFGPMERMRALIYSLGIKTIAVLGGKKHIPLRGKCRRTPILTLDLKQGELVEVRSQNEILATLDSLGRNRGLVFNAEMLKYCGKKYRVARRVDQMINEKSGRMRKLSNTVILEGVTCNGKAHGGCQRSCYSLWREIWLKRAKDAR